MNMVPPSVGDVDRLAALDAYNILDTPAEPGFDDVVHLACRLCAVPVALVSLVAGDRQWFKARVNFPSCETDLNSSVCAHALAQPERLLVIPDLERDPRTSGNPLVTGEPFIRFYAGAPLITQDGHVLGTLCVIDHHPRPDGLTDVQIEDLLALARQVMTQLDLRRAIANRDAARAEERQSFRGREALRDTQIAVTEADGDLDAVLAAVVRGAMRTVQAADGGVVELLDDDRLEYRAAQGTLSAHLGLRVPLVGSFAGHCATSHTPQIMTDAGADPHVNRELLDRLGLRSAIATPVMRGDAALGVLKLQSSRPDAFTAHDLELLNLFAGLATTGLAASEARARTRANDTYWRGLFDRLSEGFIVGEVVRDVGGRVVDWRYVEVNPAWGGLVGTDPADVIGRTLREAQPGVEDAWIDEFAEVVSTGQPATFTRYAAQLRRWYEGRAFRLDADRFGVIFLEVTARLEAEKRRSALLSLGDHLRDLTSADDMLMAASEALGTTMDVKLVGYGDVDADAETITVTRDWTVGGAPSLAGTLRFRDFGTYIDDFKRGDTVVVTDCRTDPRTRDFSAPLEERCARAFVNLPIYERGAFVGLLYVSTDEPRNWTADELTLIREVANRARLGVARVRAEDHQTVLNHELAHRLKNTLAVVQSIAAQTLRGVSERDPVQAFDRRLLALSRAHDVLLQRSWSAARLRAVMESVLAMQADLDRFALVGPDMDVSPEAAMSLSLLLHELSTNALKYGALSADGGHVRVAWRSEDERTPTLVLNWTERGGPPVSAPGGRTGFGSKLIRMGLLGTREADIRYESSGLRAEFRAPLAQFQVQVH